MKKKRKRREKIKNAVLTGRTGRKGTFMKEMVVNELWSKTNTKVVYDDEMSEYILIDKNTGHWYCVIDDIDYLNEEGNVDYELLYKVIADIANENER